jgi:hypothetical protein
MKKLGIIVFWGALWGLAEATVGYALHMLPVNIGWLVWFPLAFFFMRYVFKQTGSPAAIICAALIAAGIKFVNILMPGSIDRVVNPAVSIVLESLCMYALYLVMEKRPRRAHYEYAGVFAASILWRVCYAAYVQLLPGWMVRISPVATVDAAVQFLVVQSLINGAMISAGLWLASAIAKRKESSGDAKWIKGWKAAIPYGLLIAAVIITRVM